MRNLFILYKKDLRNLLRFGILRTEELKNPGLYNGKLGMIILFYEYSRYSGDILYEQFADEMVDSVLELPDSLSLRFADGLTGIGWGITYLLREKFIEGDVEEVLSEVDRKLEKTDSHDKIFMTDYSIYIDMRDNFKKANKNEMPSCSIGLEGSILKHIWESCFCEITNS